MTTVRCLHWECDSSTVSGECSCKRLDNSKNKIQDILSSGPAAIASSPLSQCRPYSASSLRSYDILDFTSSKCDRDNDSEGRMPAQDFLHSIEPHLSCTPALSSASSWTGYSTGARDEEEDKQLVETPGNSDDEDARSETSGWEYPVPLEGQSSLVPAPLSRHTNEATRIPSRHN